MVAARDPAASGEQLIVTGVNEQVLTAVESDVPFIVMCDNAMRFTLITLLSACALVASRTASKQKGGRSMDSLLGELVSLERSALDRWIKLDPEGYLELSAPDLTYFDPTVEGRINGLETLGRRLEPMKDAKLPFTNARYEIIDPKAQRRGDVAVLTFNLVNYGRFPDGQERVVNRWNATQVYERTEDKWTIIHTHWSYTRPELEQPRS